MTDCKGYAITGCKDGEHGWGCPLADSPEYVCEHEGCDRPAYRPKVRGELLCAIHSRKIEVGGRRSGKTYAADKQRAMWLMADEVVVVGEKRTGHRVWVCPVCYAGEGGWQVEVWNGLFPTLLDQELKTVAMIHLLDEWETHSEWCLDYLEMSRS